MAAGRAVAASRTALYKRMKLSRNKLNRVISKKEVATFSSPPPIKAKGVENRFPIFDYPDVSTESQSEHWYQLN